MSRSAGKADEFAAYGMTDSDCPDPMDKCIEGLLDKVTRLTARIEDLERQLESKSPTFPAAKFDEDNNVAGNISKGEGQ